MKKAVKGKISIESMTCIHPEDIFKAPKRKVIIIYSDKERSKAFEKRCWHFKVIGKKQKFLPLLIDYKPTAEEMKKIKSDPDFSESDTITKVMVCCQCHSIFVALE